MKYEITKGSAKDFELAPEWATLKERNTSGDLFFSEGHSVGCRVQGITTEHDFTIDDGNNDFTHLTLIAERRPITEPVVNQQLTTDFDADGLPIAGTECEAKYRDADNAEWFVIRCVGVDCGVVFGWAGKDAVTLGKGSYEFRALRSPEDIARDEAIAKICLAIGVSAENIVVQQTYDAIAAGKIPGVKLEVLRD